MLNMAPSRYLWAFLPSVIVAVAMSPIRAQANYQTCADKFVAMDLVRCPDGSVPHFNIGDPPASPAAAAAGKQAKPTTEIAGLYGIWHTNRPGASYANAMDVPGSYLLAARPGLAQGDLTISPNGTYVWNTFSGSSGRWTRGEKDAVVLYDDSTRSKWRVVAAGDGISIATNNQVFAGRR